MFSQRITNLSLSNFGPFVGSHSVSLPTNGLLLLKGNSGSGKSYLLNSIPYVLGGCPFASTELQSWFTEELPEVKLILDTQKGLIEAIRKKGLTLKGGRLKEVYKGKVADPELDAIFGMDAKVRAQVTYRGQRKPGLFLSMSDPDKKSFLTKLLDLNKYEKVEKAAKDAIVALDAEFAVKQSALDTYQKLYDIAKNDVDATKYSSSLLDDFLLDQDSTLMFIADGKQKQADISTAIEAIKKQCRDELDVLYRVIDDKLIAVSKREQPAEIATIRTEIKKQQERLEKCRKYDSDRVLEVSQQRSKINEEARDLSVKYDNLIVGFRTARNEGHEKIKFQLAEESGKKTSQLKEEEHSLKNTQKTVLLANQELEALKAAEIELKKQTCPTCKQTWANSSKKLEENLKKQEELQQFIAANSSVDISLSKVQSAIASVQVEYEAAVSQNLMQATAICDTKVKSAELEKATRVADKLLGLSLLKDPEPHPAGAQVLAKIKELEISIENLSKAFADQKSADTSLLSNEKKDIKQVTETAMVAKVAHEQVKLDIAIKHVADLTENLTTINSDIYKQQTLEVLFKERQKAIEKAAVDLDQAKAAKVQTATKLALESDLVALVGYRGFLGAIFGDILAEISSQTNDILGQVANVRHLTIDFETEKEAVTTGNVTSRITPVIYNRGRKVSFEAGISGGQQTSVELAVDLAVSNVVSNRRGVYPNFLILDESLHGLGGVDKESCIEMLQTVAGERLVLVVDHSPEFCNLFSQVIEIVQEDGQSRIL